MQEILEAARQIARKAGEILLESRPNPARLKVLEFTSKTSPTDLVSAMDEASENFIVKSISQKFPTDGIVGEDGTNRAGTSGRNWIVDPLDGTINYLYGAEHWAVSIAMEDSEGLVLGVVYAPALRLEYFALRGCGSTRIDDRGETRLPGVVEVSLASALFATGFSYESAKRREQAKDFLHILPNIQDIRRKGSAALDLCMVADGSVSGYFEVGAKPWDYSAGVIIASEAGAVASGLFGKPVSPDYVICAAPHLQRSMVQLLETIENNKH